MKKIVSALVLFSLFVVGLLKLQMAYAFPYTDIDVNTAYNMITNGSFPDLVVLDVRTQSEYDNGHIRSAVWIPHTELEARISELTGHENHEIIVYCRSGVRSVNASEILDSHNFTKVYNLIGGILEWQSAGYPVWIATVHNLNTSVNFDSIQAAIGAPQTLDGHTIFVDAGAYYENVAVTKSLSIIGENRSTTIIDGGFTGHVVEVTANNTNISGFTIRNSGCGCQAKSGVSVENCQNVNVTNSLIVQNGYGVRVDQAYNVTVAGNNITDNAYDGVYIYWSFSNTILRNNIINNDLGILSSSSTSVIFHNNFVDNLEQIYSYNSTNIWDDGYPSGGNYWNDYAGVDLLAGVYHNETGSDGIGDTSIYGDRYPLMYPINFFDAGAWGAVTYYVHTVSNSTVSDFYFNGDNKRVSFNVTGPDGTVGFCRVTIANELLWCDTPDQWTVLVNNTAVSYRVMENGDYAYLYFHYSHSIQTVQIEGIHVVPEFPAWTLMLLMLAALTVAARACKKCARFIEEGTKSSQA